MNKLLLILYLFIYGEAKAQSLEPDISRVELNTIKGKKYVFNDVEALCVLVFLSPSCPLSQKYTLTLNELAKEFRGKVKFYGVFTDADLVSDDYENFKKNTRYSLNYWLIGRTNW